MLTPTFVTSENIDCAAHDSQDNRLFIRFKNTGAVYSYKDVPHTMFAAMIAAESVGKWFHHNIRKNKDIRFRIETTDPFTPTLQ